MDAQVRSSLIPVVVWIELLQSTPSDNSSPELESSVVLVSIRHSDDPFSLEVTELPQVKTDLR